MSEQFKRNVAYKYRIGDVLLGKPMFDGERFSFLELGDRKIVRINVIGNIIDKYESDGERKYIFFTLDDGSGQIKIKCFGDEAARFKDVFQGQTVLVIGVLRNFNNETYLSPEIIREQDTKYLLIRKLETEKDKSKNAQPMERNQIVAVRDKILDIIKDAEKNGGIEMDKVIMDLRDVSPSIIHQEIKKLLEEGIIFEPQPGKIRWLG
ncbi:OB-fold nucleic acid binding domain-containing protein [Candidatus Pacearchaeota archaeon]|jgi:RPA family protein|nr:OB-fold nucleic acid binding domain-containing protein [Candidatus Pacearchaeota archaeon]